MTSRFFANGVEVEGEYLDVPYKDQAKIFGARWNPLKKLWFIPHYVYRGRSKFNKWRVNPVDPKVPKIRHKKIRDDWKKAKWLGFKISEGSTWSSEVDNFRQYIRDHNDDSLTFEKHLEATKYCQGRSWLLRS